MDHPTTEALAFEQIGRILVAWGHLDQAITRHTWRDNDPISPFPSGPVERTFYKRWCRWCASREASCKPTRRRQFNVFREDVLTLSAMRDDLAHNVSTITAYDGGKFRVMATRWAKTDWRERLDVWAAKHGRKRNRNTPPMPLGFNAHIDYWDSHIRELSQSILAAQQTIALIWECENRRVKFDPPSISIVGRELADLARANP